MISIFINSYSQEPERKFGLKETFHFGAILPHRQEVNEVVEGHTFAGEISYYKPTTGKKKWQQLYGYPNVGVSALFTYLSNPDELGNAFGVFPFVELPLNRRKINWRLKMGYGLGYLTKRSDRTSNYKNIAIGSHINALIYANMLWEIKLGKLVNISSGISIIHFSNASFAKPNLGLNIASLSFGVTYNFGALEEKITNEWEERERIWKQSFMTSIGFKEAPPLNKPSPKYFVNTYSYNLIKQGKAKGSFGFGADVFYNTALQDLMLIEDATTESKVSNNIRVGVAGIYSFDFGKISLMIQMGGYLYTNYQEQGRIYHRVTSRYHLSDKVFLNLGIKTHYAVADFGEVGVGYIIGK